MCSLQDTCLKKGAKLLRTMMKAALAVGDMLIMVSEIVRGQTTLLWYFASSWCWSMCLCISSEFDTDYTVIYKNEIGASLAPASESCWKKLEEAGCAADEWDHPQVDHHPVDVVVLCFQSFTYTQLINTLAQLSYYVQNLKRYKTCFCIMFSKGANEWKRVCTICENCGDHEAANFAKVNVI